MKKLIILVSLFISQLAFAQNNEAQLAHPVAASMTVEYYNNLIPIVIEDGSETPDRRVFSVVAVVEYCRTVSADEFALTVEVTEPGNILQLHAKNFMIDCFGPTREQALRFRLPKEADRSLPFMALEHLPVIHTGDVH